MAHSETLGPVDVQSEVPVAELKPVVHTESGELLVGDEGIATASPTVRALYRGERVDHRVEVGRHMQAMHQVVVSDIDDDGQFHSVQTQESPCEAGSTHPAR